MVTHSLSQKDVAFLEFECPNFFVVVSFSVITATILISQRTFKEGKEWVGTWVGGHVEFMSKTAQAVIQCKGRQNIFI